MDNILYNSIGQRLASFIKKKGFNQSNFAKTLDLPANAISRYCSGKVGIPIEILNKIHEMYNVNINWLITGINSYEPEEKYSKFDERRITYGEESDKDKIIKLLEEKIERLEKNCGDSETKHQNSKIA